MDPTLTDEELTRFREAFNRRDTTGEGTILARDLCGLMESVGATPPRLLRTLCDRPGAEDWTFSFDEFLRVAFGPPWEPVEPDPEAELNEAFADFDDGSGYVPVRDLMRIVDEHMKKGGYRPTDGDLFAVYRQALDGDGLPFATVGGELAPESMWKVFQEEFADFRKAQGTEGVDAATAATASCFPMSRGRKWRDVLARLRSVRVSLARFRQLRSQFVRRSVGADADWKRAGETPRMIKLTVANLGGEQLMLDAVDPTWSVQALQQRIEGVLGVPVHRQFLFLAGEDGLRQDLCRKDASLSTAGVVDGSTLLLAVKDEFKVDYKKFVSRLMDVDIERATAGAQIYGHGV